MYWRKRRGSLCEAVDTAILDLLAVPQAPRRRGSPRPGIGSPCSSRPARSAASSAGTSGTPRPARSGSTPGRACSRCRRSSTSCSRTPGPRARTWTWSRWTRGAARLPRRHVLDSCAGPGVRRPDRGRLRRRGGRRLAAVVAAGRAGLDGLVARSCAAPSTRPRDAGRRWPGGWTTWPRSRPAGPCAAWAAGTCATRGCGCCWTGMPPIPAPTPPGAGRAGRDPLRRADLRRLVPARWAGHPRRRAARALRASA